MKRDLMTMQLDLGHELIIDNFAGGGGASEGIEQAIGRDIDVAINHNGEALAMHAANHPGTAHYVEDVFAIHPGFVTKHRPIGLAWFSPDCKHHSKAKGGKPREKKIRGLAWVTLKWAAFQMPRCIGLENVEEFLDWGPLDENGEPIKALKGRTFSAFIDALTTGLAVGHPDTDEIYEALGADFPMLRLHAGLGYQVEWRILRACDYGTPTIRKRLFVFMRRDRRPIMWPAPTHGNPKAKGFAASGLLPWRTAAECIDWSIPCPSIFGREKPLADKTLARIAKGVKKFIIDSADPFIVRTAHGDISPSGVKRWGKGEHAGDEPLPTVTGSNDFAWVVPTLAPFVTEHANGSHQRVFGADEPLRTQCAEVKGGHFALVSAMLAKHYGGVTGTAVTVPFGAVTTSDHHSVVSATLKKGRAHRNEVRAFLIKYYSSGGQDQLLTDPLHTIPTADRFGLVTIHGVDYAIVDIGMRMLTPRELARAQGFPDSYILEAVHNGKKLSKAAQVRMIGNSVCPPLARALVEANFTHEHQFNQAAA